MPVPPERWSQRIGRRPAVREPTASVYFASKQTSSAATTAMSLVTPPPQRCQCSGRRALRRGDRQEHVSSSRTTVGSYNERREFQVLTQVAEGVLVHDSEFLQSNAVVVQGTAGVLLIDPGITDAEMAAMAKDISA